MAIRVMSCRPAWLDSQEGLLARFVSRFYQTATLNHDSETLDHITWFVSAHLARVRLGKALQTSAPIRSQNGLGEALLVIHIANPQKNRLFDPFSGHFTSIRPTDHRYGLAGGLAACRP